MKNKDIYSFCVIQCSHLFSASMHHIGVNDGMKDSPASSTDSIILEGFVSRGLHRAIEAVISHKLRNNESSQLGSKVVSIARLLKERLDSGQAITSELE